MQYTRRDFLKTGAVGLAGCSVSAAQAGLNDERARKRKNELAGQIGITTSSVGAQTAGRAKGRKFTLLELPRIMRDELGMRVIDLNTSSLTSFEPSYLEKVRAAADKAGCILTNLKLNQRGLDMNSPDKSMRDKTLREYKRSIDAARQLGLMWARPLPLMPKPDMDIHVASYHELCDYAAERNIEMLVENFGWMQSDPNSVVKLVKAIGRNVAACPDTGNWDSNEIRYQGLAKTFPIAVTCDFKAKKMGPNGEHPLYDLKRCFTIGWKAGFRGPWCLEHANTDTKILLGELRILRDMLQKWMAEST